MAKEEKFVRLINQLHSGKWGKRYSAAEALGKLADERAVPELIAILGDSVAIVRSAAAEALGELADERAIPALVNALADEEKAVLVAAAGALGKLGDTNVVEPVLKLLTDSDHLVRSTAATALVQLGYGGTENEVLTKAGVDLSIDLAEPELSAMNVRAIILLALIPVGVVTGIMVLINYLRHGSLHNMWVYGLTVITAFIILVLLSDRIAQTEVGKNTTKLALTAIVGWVLASLVAFHFIVGWGPDAVTIQVNIKATESGFEAPDEIEAGLVTFNFESLPKSSGNFVIMRLKDSRTYDDLKSVLPTRLDQLSSIVEFYGGTSALGLGNSRLTLDLNEGLYAISSWRYKSDIIEISRGVLRALRVVGRTSDDKLKAPTPYLTIRLNDSSMKVPGWWDYGNQTLLIINNGTTLHRFNIGKLNEGKTVEDLQAWLASPRTSPPPHRQLLTTGILSPGRGGWFIVGLEGRLTDYDCVAYCDLPGPSAPESHFGVGEFAVFYVRSIRF